VNDWPKADLSVIEIGSGAVRKVAVTAAAESDPHYSPDGRWIAFRRSDEPVTWAFTNDVYVVPASGGNPRKLAETSDRGPTIVGWNGNGSAVLVSETRGTVSRLLSVPRSGSAPTDVSPPDMMVGNATLNSGGTHVAFVSEAPDRPPEVFTTPLSRFAAAQVSRVQDVAMDGIGRTEVVRWRSSDGFEIEGLLTFPLGYREGTRVPTLVIIHGGPTGVFTESFIGAATQYPVAVFAARGYAVLRPNPRGSSGYGREFRYANYGDWGGGDYRDIMSGVDALVQRGVADPDRLGIMGWSYGGFMTSWIVTQTNRFRAASIGAALPNLMSFSGTSDVPDFIPDYFGGDYWERKDQWEAHSPLFQVRNARTPSLIQHGEVDDRVPVSQAYEFYNALKRLGVPARLVIYPRTPHGIREPKLLRDAMDRNLEWFDRWLRAAAATSSKN
jgi:dipeptidyl aminopeptidase/acylaminoacyl peptidase